MGKKRILQKNFTFKRLAKSLFPSVTPTCPRPYGKMESSKVILRRKKKNWGQILNLRFPTITFLTS